MKNKHYYEHSTREIAKILGLSNKRVLQIEKSALKKISKLINIDLIEDAITS